MIIERRLFTDEEFSSFINPEELCQYIINAISYDSDMITEEVRFNRVNVQ